MMLRWLRRRQVARRLAQASTIHAPSSLHFAIERRPSTKSHVDLVPTPVILERHEERTFRDLDSVYLGEGHATTDSARVLDGNRVSRGSIFHCSLELAPSLWNAGIDRQERSAESQTEQLSTPARCSQPAEPVYQVQPPRPICGAVEYMSAHTT
jgi:hypothetical protein